LDTDLAADLKEAIAATEYDSAYKIAWESRRFWEQDCRIYGGLSFAQQTIGVIWYPSWGLFTDRGVIVAGYGVENGTSFVVLI
jgi:monoamine oxidase